MVSLAVDLPRQLPRLEKKARVAIDWTLDLFFSKDLVQFQTERSAIMQGKSAHALTEPRQ
jgi:hypothetical protein